ncbi:hypothetical protein [Paenibacillus aestuarii]|uniref:Uncharacterized protein n=1 Tax=Paenibacillus aestuarii TaxID=516965 RepID=A0ABW0K521_9BACL|nr:hypothetical protein [Paenibacillus aestuarii]
MDKTLLERGKAQRRLLQLDKTGLERGRAAKAAPIGQNWTEPD